jgi:hypothetical protein
VLDEGEVVAVDLTAIERAMLVSRLNDWAGPAHCTEAMARAMGFRDKEDLHDDGRRITNELREDRSLSRRDWTRALLSLEIIFGSDLLGTGTEGGTIQGGDDVEWLRTLRKLQHKLPVSQAYLPH